MARQRLVETIRKIRVALTFHNIARAKNLLSDLEYDIQQIHNSVETIVHTTRADLSLVLHYLEEESKDPEEDLDFYAHS
jgi:hypothetical protein